MRDATPHNLHGPEPHGPRISKNIQFYYSRKTWCVMAVACKRCSYNCKRCSYYKLHCTQSKSNLGVLLPTQFKMWQHPSQGGRFTWNSKYRRCTFSVTISHSPITLVNLSSINLVSIFKCSSPPLNPVNVRRVDPSVKKKKINVLGKDVSGQFS